jgi:hypothetical protein
MYIPDELKNECDALRQKYAGILIGGEDHSRQARKNNVMALLKYTFPGTRFTAAVRPNCDEIRVKWTDGPTEDQVNEILSLFKSGRWNGPEELMEPRTTAFLVLFGGFTYAQTWREFSPMAWDQAERHFLKAFPEAFDLCANDDFIPQVDRPEFLGEGWKLGHRTTPAICQRHFLTDLDLQPIQSARRK